VVVPTGTARETSAGSEGANRTWTPWAASSAANVAAFPNAQLV
jgi:hypothetical protein